MRWLDKGMGYRRGPPFQALATGLEQQRFEITLYRQALRQRAVRPDGIDRLIQSQRIDARLARIGGHLFTRTLGKADHGTIGVAFAQRSDDPRIGRYHPTDRKSVV